MGYRITRAIIATFVVALAACGRTFDADKDGCFDMNESAFQNDITAGPTPAQAVALGITGRNLITLVPMEGGYGGYVQEATSAADYYYFLSRDIPFAVEVKGTSLAVPVTETVRPFTACAGVAVRYTVPLKDGTHVLKLGPTAEAGAVTMASVYDVMGADGGGGWDD